MYLGSSSPSTSSRRQWDGLVKHWRRALHRYDPEPSKDTILKEDLNATAPPDLLPTCDEVDEEDLDKAEAESSKLEASTSASDKPAEEGDAAANVYRFSGMLFSLSVALIVVCLGIAGYWYLNEYQF